MMFANGAAPFVQIYEVLMSKFDLKSWVLAILILLLKDVGHYNLFILYSIAAKPFEQISDSLMTGCFVNQVGLKCFGVDIFFQANTSMSLWPSFTTDFDNSNK